MRVWRNTIQNVYEKEDLWDMLEPEEEDFENDPELGVVDEGSHKSKISVSIPTEGQLLRRRKLRAIMMLKLTVSPKALPFIRDIRDQAAAWRFFNENTILTRLRMP